MQLPITLYATKASITFSPVCLYVCLSVCMFVSPSVCLSLHLCVCLSVRLCVCIITEKLQIGNRCNLVKMCIMVSHRSVQILTFTFDFQLFSTYFSIFTGGIGEEIWLNLGLLPKIDGIVQDLCFPGHVVSKCREGHCYRSTLQLKRSAC